jgi:cytochrome c-type biogenesis protein CcmH
MVFWIISGGLTLGIAGLMLHGLLRGTGEDVTGAASDVSVYRDQLDEVARDQARGVLSDTEAEAVRLEVSRRLLEADKRATDAAVVKDGGRTLAMVLIPMAMLVGGAALYMWIGAPGYRDLPLDTRLAEIEAAIADRPSQSEAEELAASNLPQVAEVDPDFLELMTRLRAAIESRPDDEPGLLLLARNEARLGNFVAAREAQEHLLTVKGERVSARDLSVAIELMTYAAGGYLSPEAEVYLRRLLEIEPQNGEGRYFLGLLHAQNGRPDLAFPVWRRLLEESNPNAPWLPVILNDIENLARAAGVNYTPPPVAGPDAGAIAAAEDMTPEDRQEMIQGMVEGLASRLAEDGGTPDEWAQLIRALSVLGDEQRARAVYAEAKQVFGASEDAMTIIFRAGIDTGLEN